MFTRHLSDPSSDAIKEIHLSSSLHRQASYKNVNCCLLLTLSYNSHMRSMPPSRYHSFQDHLAGKSTEEPSVLSLGVCFLTFEKMTILGLVSIPTFPPNFLVFFLRWVILHRFLLGSSSCLLYSVFLGGSVLGSPLLSPGGLISNHE